MCVIGSLAVKRPCLFIPGTLRANVVFPVPGFP